MQLKNKKTGWGLSGILLLVLASCGEEQRLEREQQLLQYSRDSLQRQLDSICSVDESIHYRSIPLYEPHPIISEPDMNDKWH